jgi:WD40 repeat protein
LAIAPDGKTIAFAGQDGASTWDLKETVQPLEGQTAPATVVAFSPAGSRIAVDDANGTIRLFDAQTRAEVGTIDAQLGGTTAMAFARAGDLIAAAGQNGAVKLWKVDDGEPVRTLVESGAAVHSIAFSPDGKHLAAAIGNTVVLFDLGTGQRAAAIEGHTGEVHSVTFSYDGKTLVSGGQDRTIRLWDVARALAEAGNDVRKGGGPPKP